MDLALLVYGISLLSKVSAFIAITILICGFAVGFFFVWYVSETDRKSYYSEKENDAREANGTMCVKMIKRAIVIGFILAFTAIFIPSEKTAYTMVGAYAAQKVAENEKVQQMSGKVLTIIEQQLDSYIQEGIKEAEDKVSKKEKSRK